MKMGYETVLMHYLVYFVVIALAVVWLWSCVAVKARTLKIALLAAPLLLIIAIVALPPANLWWYKRQCIKQALQIERQIESYRASHGKYPDSLSQIGIVETESGPIYYERKSESSYILWFGTILGESEKFDSTTRKWN